ncbi:MAG TPA: HesA/MoeB/ThiF family protein [Candidatus Binataceae bacterium]
MVEKRILIVGMGGLGVPAAWALARAKAGVLVILDPDPVELSNLPRQVIYRESDIGSSKVDAAVRRLRAAFPAIEIENHPVALDSSNADSFVDAGDIVIDATDDPRTKFLINDTCISNHKPFVYGGVLGMTGQAMTVLPGKTACLRCLFENPPDDAEAASCRDAGIVGPVAGAIGEVQASEALRFVGGAAPRLAGAMLSYDGTDPARVRVSPVSPRAGCRCGARKISKDAHSLEEGR